MRKKKNSAVLPKIKTTLCSSPWHLGRLVKVEGSGDAKAREPLPTRNGLLSVIHQPLTGQPWMGRHHWVPEPWSCTALDEQLDMRLLWCKILSPHTCGQNPASEKEIFSWCLRQQAFSCRRLPLPRILRNSHLRKGKDSLMPGHMNFLIKHAKDTSDAV